MFGFIEALDSKGISNTLKIAITSAMECADLTAFSRSYCYKFLCNFASISCGFGQLKRILWLFLRGELHVRDLKKHEIFAEVNKNLPELSVFVSMLGENPTVIKLAVYNVNLSLCDLRDFSA